MTLPNREIVTRWTVLLPVLLLGPILAQDRPADKDQEEENARIAAPLPDGEAKTILLARCVGCHGLARVAVGKKSLKSWTNTIKEVEPLAKLLAASFALPVNINTATASELAAVPGLEPSLAAAIVRYREKNGEFSTVLDLSRVEGVSENLLGKISRRLTVGVPPATPDGKQ
jgi:competence protein ComEA